MQVKATTPYLHRQFGKGVEHALSVERRLGQVRQLDKEIEDLREKLHRLVSANPARLRSGEVYQVSTKLDQLITKLQGTTGSRL